MVAAEETALDAVKKLRAQNLKDIEENNNKIQALEESRASIAQSLKDIGIRRSEAGLSSETKRNRELSRLQQELLRAPALPEDKQTETLNRIAQRANQLSNSAKEGGVQFNQALNLAESAFKKLDALKDFQILKGKAEGTGLEADAERLKAATASMDESVDGFTQSLKFLETEIANANLTMAVEMLDNATGPGEEIRNSLENLFASPITQEIIVKQTNAIAKFRGGGNKSDSFFSDGVEFQASTSDLTGFGPGVVKAPDSFASGIRYIQRDSLVKVHKGERILSRTEADQERQSGSGGGTLQFNGDIIIQNVQGSVDPRAHAEELFSEFEKIVELKKG